MNPLTTVKWPLIIGFVLAIIIAALVDGGLSFNTLTMAALARWLHIVAGIFWIGLLYYFNAVQVPAVGVANADKGALERRASTNMSHPALCCGSAGRRWPPGFWVPGSCPRPPGAS